MKRNWRVAFSAVAVTTGPAVLIAIALGSNGRDMVQYSAAAMLYGISSGEDVDECARTLDTFLRRHDVPKNSKSAPGRPPIFCNPGSTGVVFKLPQKFVVYGTVDKDIQEKYLDTLRFILQRSKSKALSVEFYEQENWVEWKSTTTGASGGERGPERLLRKETLGH